MTSKPVRIPVDGVSVPGISAGWRASGSAFTLIEMLVVIAVVAILTTLALPPLHRAKSRGVSTYCANNFRQLGIAMHLYAADHDDALPYNMGTEGIHKTVADGTYLNWVNNVMSWELDAENTNTALLTTGGLGPYVSRAATVYRCPSDRVLSAQQRQAGWTERVRSVSMNAMLGYAGEFMAGKINTNNPSYRQFFRLSEIPDPSQIFAFVEEHPDSINDGYFINRFSYHEWTDLPASYHHGGANFIFADGHAEFHAWRLASTMPPARPDAASLPLELGPTDRSDLYWVLARTSIRPPNGISASSQ